MKALLSIDPGGPETLQLTDVADPVAGPGELLVRVRACAINYPDVLIIEDKYQFRPSRPFAHPLISRIGLRIAPRAPRFQPENKRYSTKSTAPTVG